MKKFLIRGIALFTVVIMLFSVTACGSGSNNSTGTKAGNSTSIVTQGSQAAEKELITLTLYPQKFAKNYPSGIQDDPVAKDIENKLRIKIDMDTQPTKEKLSVLVASGSLPDVVCSEDVVPLIDNMVKGRSIIELDDLVAKYGPDIQKNAQIALNFSKQEYSNGENKLYFIPGLIADVNDKMRTSPWGVIVGPFIRWDYYKEIGAPEIKGDDDFLNVVAQILKKHPKNEDGQKLFGFSPWFDQGMAWMAAQYYQWMYGKDYTGNLQTDRTNIDVTIPMYTSPDSGFWQGVEFWYKANKMGLLDPDCFTQKNANALEKAGANRVIASTFQWPVQPTTKLLAEKGLKAAGFAAYPIPVTGANNYYDIPSPNGNITRSWCISKSCKYPERAMELINYFYSVDGVNTVMNGFKDQQWKEVNGKYQYIDAFVQQKSTDKDWDTKTGITKYQNLQGLAGSFINPNTSEPIDLTLSKATNISQMSDVDKDMAAFYKVDSLMDLAPKDSTNNVDIAQAVIALMNQTPTDEIKRLTDKENNYINTASIKAILAKSDAEFAQVKQEIINELKTKYSDDVIYNFTVERWKEAVAKWKSISGSN